MTRVKCAIVIGLLVFGSTMTLAETSKKKKGGWTYDEGIRFESADERFDVHIQNRIQVRGTSTDPDVGSSLNSFDVARYKFRIDGRAFKNWDFVMQADLDNGSETEAELLEDAWVKYTKYRHFQLWAGQGKVAFGRQFLIDSGRLQFVDRSRVTDVFAHGRDVGVALIGENKRRTYEYSAGVYNGNGINKDVDVNDEFMVTGRLVAMPLGPFELSESDPDWAEYSTGQRLAIGVSVLSNRPSADGDFEPERNVIGNLEFAYRIRGLNLQAEFFTQNNDQLLSDPGQEIENDGWYAQAGYVFRNGFELAGRFGEILLDDDDRDIQEASAGIGYYFHGQSAKLQADFTDVDFEEGFPDASSTTDTQEFRIQLQLIF